MHKQKVIAIVGPTASGKSALGIYLAKKLHGEVISADSRQVYLGLDIGTGKVTKREMAGIPHHLLDVASPKRVYTVSDFEKAATKAFRHIKMQEKTPIVVGGTGLYVDVLLGRMSVPEVPPNQTLRAHLEKKTAAQLFAMLTKKDPRRAATIESDHPRRLIRALEIAEALGKNPEPKITEPYDVLWLGLNPEAKVLEKKIHTRLLSRMKQGMVAEARRLHKQGLSYKRMETLGLEYRALSSFLQGRINKGELAVEIERGNIQYAKRQIRWFKRNKNIHWISRKTEALGLAKKYLSS